MKKTTRFKEVIQVNGFSIEIEKFLRFCRQCVDTNRRAAIAEIDADNKMQDILHRIELGENYQIGRAHV